MVWKNWKVALWQDLSVEVLLSNTQAVNLLLLSADKRYSQRLLKMVWQIILVLEVTATGWHSKE